MIQHFLLLLCVASVWATHQNYPGTSKRPVLSDAEAALYTKSAYLGGWTPGTISHSRADYTVGSGGYTYIQEAINAAIKDGGTTRKYIHIKPDTYKQTVIIPKTTVPITIYGTYGSPNDVHIILSQSASTTGSQYASQTNPGGKVFKNGDPGWSRYNYCAGKSTLGTDCSAVVWVEADNVEFLYVTIENPSTQAQAVAATILGGKNNWDHVNFYGFQDTLYLRGQYIYLSNPQIKGDVDFIFGEGSVVLENAKITCRADRPRTSGVVFAPDTNRDQKYGFLVINSQISAESAIQAAKGLSLARAWQSSSTDNGQLVIRNTQIDNGINVDAPYTVSTGGNAFSGNIMNNRNLNDYKYNRFWEYKNTGAAA